MAWFVRCNAEDVEFYPGDGPAGTVHCGCLDMERILLSNADFRAATCVMSEPHWRSIYPLYEMLADMDRPGSSIMVDFTHQQISFMTSTGIQTIHYPDMFDHEEEPLPHECNAKLEAALFPNMRDARGISVVRDDLRQALEVLIRVGGDHGLTMTLEPGSDQLLLETKDEDDGISTETRFNITLFQGVDSIFVDHVLYTPATLWRALGPDDANEHATLTLLFSPKQPSPILIRGLFQNDHGKLGHWQTLVAPCRFEDDQM